MAITRFFEIGSSQSGDVDKESVRNYTRAFQVESNSKYDTIHDIEIYAGIPSIGTPHPHNPLARVQQVQVRYDEPTALGAFYTATVTYSTKFDNQQNQNPLLRPVKVNLDFTIFRKVVRIDLAGYPITNSAGDPPSEPVEIDAAHPILKFTRNEATQPFSLMIDYAEAINSDSFYGAAPGTVRVMIRCGDAQTENDVQFYQVEYTFEYRKEGWDPKFLNIGFNTYANGKKVPIPGDTPRLLHDGNPNSQFPARTTTIATTPEFMTKYVHERKSFAIFAL